MPGWTRMSIWNNKYVDVGTDPYTPDRHLKLSLGWQVGGMYVELNREEVSDLVDAMQTWLGETP